MKRKKGFGKVMMELKRKTRLNVETWSMRKVYFACHQDDFEKYFQTVTDKILAIVDCSIYYYDDFENYIPFGEIEEVFKEIQLVVFPVTSNFLFTENRARLVDFKCAKEKNIPILPLMQEPALARRFNLICGDLQYLSKFEEDKTTLSYGEKLEKYLNRVLVSGEIEQRIKESFDAYIFLSYRKKDRRHAQSVMRLLHKNEKYRSVAVWYDEFLVPGEDFGDAIFEAIKNSRIFTIVVTPNLVNENNYVLEKEYPYACEHGIPILPIQTCETDFEQLSQKYTSIPQPIKYENEDAILGFLDENLSDFINLNQEKNLQKQRYVALAYLNGIDVEIDKKFAISRLTDLANAEYPEAIETLIDIYLDGNGVRRDRDKALEWKRKLVDIERKKFEENNEKVYFFLAQMDSFARMLREGGKYRQAVSVWQEYISVCKQMEISDKLIFGYEMIADNYRDLGDRTKESEALNVGYKIAKEYGYGDDFLDYSVFVSIASRLAMVSTFDNAHAIYREIISTYISELPEGPDEDFEFEMGELLQIYLSYGKMLQKNHYLDKALDCFNKALKIGLRLIDIKNDVENNRALSTCYCCLGKIYFELKDDEKAKKHFENAVSKAKEIYEADGEKNSIFALGYVYGTLSDFYYDKGELALATEYNDKAIELYSYAYEKYMQVNFLKLLVEKYEYNASLYACKDNGLFNRKKSRLYYKKRDQLLEILCECVEGREALELMLRKEHRAGYIGDSIKHHFKAYKISEHIEKRYGRAFDFLESKDYKKEYINTFFSRLLTISFSFLMVIACAFVAIVPNLISPVFPTGDEKIKCEHVISQNGNIVLIDLYAEIQENFSGGIKSCEIEYTIKDSNGNIVDVVTYKIGKEDCAANPDCKHFSKFVNEMTWKIKPLKLEYSLQSLTDVNLRVESKIIEIESDYNPRLLKLELVIAVGVFVVFLIAVFIGEIIRRKRITNVITKYDK